MRKLYRMMPTVLLESLSVVTPQQVGGQQHDVAVVPDTGARAWWLGPIVRLELDLVAGGWPVEAHVPRGRFDGLALAKGRHVYVSPTNVRVFARSDHS